MTVYDPLKNTFAYKGIKAKSIFHIMWHITSKCNMNCSFCFDKKNSDIPDMTFDQIDTIIKVMKELGVIKVDISGGEPFLFDKFIYLVQKCIDMGMYVTVTTSGQTIEKNYLWILDNWKIFSRIIFSLDGLEQEHIFFRGNDTAFSKFYEFYHALMEKKCSTLRINTVVTNRIIEKGYLQEFANFIVELNPLEWCLIMPLKNINNVTRSELNEICVNKYEFENVVNICNNVIKDTKIELLFRTNEMYSSYWTLTSDGILSNNNIKHNIHIPLLTTDLNDIQNIVGQYTQFLP